MIKNFQDLSVWDKAHALVLDAYKITAGFPPEERFGLVPQMRRAAVSVPANIAEGFKRRTKADKMHFYNISQGSLEELRYYFILSKDLGYASDNKQVLEDSEVVGRMLTSLISSIKAAQ